MLVSACNTLGAALPFAGGGDVASERDTRLVIAGGGDVASERDVASHFTQMGRVKKKMKKKSVSKFYTNLL